ncbi:MAG TPA: RNA polymerase sigma factor [Labilithrix sp.]|nr:RNA polymerase sigma factor [Labilithrix sp.]
MTERSDEIAPAIPSPTGLGSSLFRQVFETEYDYVWASLRRLGTPERDREDLVHEVFVRVHKNLESYDRARPIRPWLFAFVFRVASEHRRLRRNMWEEPRADLDREVSVEEATAGESRDLVHRALDALSETTRPVFVMYELDGFTMKEIAEVLEVPLDTAYSRLRLGRTAFVARIRELETEGGGA